MEKTLAKGLLVLEALILCEESAGVSEVAEILGISKSNAHRLLRTLVEMGFVASSEGRYWATLKVWELGSHVIKRYDVKELARPFMTRVAAQTAEEVRLAVFDVVALEVVYIDKIDSAQDVRAFSEIGSRSPAYCTSSGKALLTYLGDDIIAKVSESLAPRTRWTITEPAKFVANLEKARDEGYALSEREFSEQVSGVGAPIFGRDGSVVAAISVIGPAERFPPKRLREIGALTRQACDDVSARISPPQPNVVHLKQGLQRLSRKNEASQKSS